MMQVENFALALSSAGNTFTNADVSCLLCFEMMKSMIGILIKRFIENDSYITAYYFYVDISALYIKLIIINQFFKTIFKSIGNKSRKMYPK